MSSRVGARTPSDASEMAAASPFCRLAHSTTPFLPCDDGAPTRGYILESVAEGTDELRHMPIAPLPFRIGRRPGLELVLPSNCVSKTHAEIFEREGGLHIRDLQSRNGTFVNHQPVSEAEIAEGDIVHVGDFEFRIGRQAEDASDGPGAATTPFLPVSLSPQFRERGRDLRGLLDQGHVVVVLQPIVHFASGTIGAFEALGRGAHPGLPREPVDLFGFAETMGVEVELSRLFRRRAVELASRRPQVASLFLNTHPAEIGDPGLVESLETLRSLAPHLDLTLEIHESALAQPDAMAALRERLGEINVGLAYDDFGAGQARLLELAEAPPHFLKFDRRFVMDIDQAPAARQRLVASLVAAARELLVKTVAEGVETSAEAETCARLGFTLGQGYHFGRPAPIDAI